MQRTQAILVLMVSGTMLQAAPKLRLSTTTVGPLSVAQGANAAVRTIDAFNAGDGALNLQYSSSASWVSASTGGGRPCLDRPVTCLPVNFAFNTASLPVGTQTATVTVSDPNALDAPQTVTVTVQVGGGVPARVSLYVPPNGASAESPFSSNSNLTANATTQSGGPWLSLTLDGTGSFRFVYPYRIRARHLESMPEGTYNGQITTNGSSIPAENRAVPVTLLVTSQPIANAPEQVVIRAAQGAANPKAALVLGNTGLGALAVGGVTTTTSSGGEWLSAEKSADSNLITLTAKLEGLGPGVYNGTAAVASNAANGTQNVPVRLEIVPQGPPVVAFDSVRDTGAAETIIAPGGLATLSGEQFTLQEPQAPTDFPLPTEIDGVRVLVNDLPAALSFVSANRINFQVPFDVQPGDAVVAVERQGTRGNGVSVQVAGRAPRIVRTGVGESGLILNPDGVQATAQTPARPGENITIFCVGLGPTDMAVPTGALGPAEEPLPRVTPAPLVEFGSPFTGTSVGDPSYAGLASGLVGVYHVVVTVPAEVPLGDIFVRLVGNGYESNRVILPIR